MTKLRKKMSEQRAGKVWVNNGKINKCVFPEKIPEGFVLGAIPSEKQKHINRGRIYITNGIKNSSIYLNQDPIPEGWWIGKTNSETEKAWHAKQKNMVYVTDGRINKRVDQNCIPSGFRIGRTLTKNQKKCDHSKNMKGKRWITNGQTSLVIKKGDPVPESFHYGRFQSDKMIAGYKISGEKNRKHNEEKRQSKLPKCKQHDIMQV